MDREDSFSKQGIQVAVIGSGAPHYAKAFRESVGGRVPIYTDPSLQTFDALSFKRGLGGLLKGAMWKRGMEAFMQGHRQGKVQGDTRQLGGVLGLSNEARKALNSFRESVPSSLVSISSNTRRNSFIFLTYSAPSPHEITTEHLSMVIEDESKRGCGGAIGNVVKLA